MTPKISASDFNQRSECNSQSSVQLHSWSLVPLTKSLVFAEVSCTTTTLASSPVNEQMSQVDVRIRNIRTIQTVSMTANNQTVKRIALLPSTIWAVSKPATMRMILLSVMPRCITIPIALNSVSKVTPAARPVLHQSTLPIASSVKWNTERRLRLFEL